MINPEIYKKLNTLTDYTVNKTLGETNGLKEIKILENNVLFVNILLMKKNEKLKDKVKSDLVRMVKLDLGFSGIKFQFDYYQLDKKFIFISSGKGGVGKSTVAALLALYMKDKGFDIGLVDADIYGPSLSLILNINDAEMKGNKDEQIYPYNYDGIEYISVDLFTKEDPLMLRGPMLGKMLEMFFNDVLWSNKLEYIIVDMPPGTGDVALDLNDLCPNNKTLLVTTPNVDASKVAIKAGLGAMKINQEILGIVENMSYYLNPVNKERLYIFGTEGSKLVSQKLNKPILARLPIIPNQNIEILKNNDIIKNEFDNIINEILKEEEV